MPIVGFKDPHNGKTLTAEELEQTTHHNHRPSFPAWIARFAIENQKSDVRHAGLDITATRCLGCPRQTFLETQFDYLVNPQTLWSRTRGTIQHSAAAKYMDPEVWITEQVDPVRLTLEGVLGGVKISLLCDAIKQDMSEILDHKFPGDMSVYFRKDIAKPDHVAQLNMARLLLAQQQWALDAGYDPATVKLTLADYATGKGKYPIHQTAPHWDEEQLLAHNVGGCEYTVRDLLDMWEYIQANKETATATEANKREFASTLPLVGRGQLNGSKCTGYCEVKELCDSVLTEFGAPTAATEHPATPPATIEVYQDPIAAPTARDFK